MCVSAFAPLLLYYFLVYGAFLAWVGFLGFLVAPVTARLGHAIRNRDDLVGLMTATA
jgi:hypothetical protein